MRPLILLQLMCPLILLQLMRLLILRLKPSPLPFPARPRRTATHCSLIRGLREMTVARWAGRIVMSLKW